MLCNMSGFDPDSTEWNYDSRMRKLAAELCLYELTRGPKTVTDSNSEVCMTEECIVKIFDDVNVLDILSGGAYVQVDTARTS